MISDHRGLAAAVAFSGVFVAAVLMSGQIIAGPRVGVGERAIRQATDQERALLKQGPVTDARYLTAMSWTAQCLQAAGSQVTAEDIRDLRLRFPTVITLSTTGETSSVDGAVQRCNDLSSAVHVAYVYERTSFWSWDRPLRGTGPALRELRAEDG